MKKYLLLFALLPFLLLSCQSKKSDQGNDEQAAVEAALPKITVIQKTGKTHHLGVYSGYETMSMVKKDGKNVPAIFAMEHTVSDEVQVHYIPYTRYVDGKEVTDHVAVDLDYYSHGNNHPHEPDSHRVEFYLIADLDTSLMDIESLENTINGLTPTGDYGADHWSPEVHTHKPCGSFGCRGGSLLQDPADKTNCSGRRMVNYILDPANASDQAFIAATSNVDPDKVRCISFTCDVVHVVFSTPQGSEQKWFAVNLRDPVIIQK